MIRENQQLFNRLNVLSDGILIYLMLPVAYWIRFSVMPNGIVSIPLSGFLRLGVVFTLVQLFTYAAFRLYQSNRKTRIRDELIRLLEASLLDAMMLLSYLFVGGEDNYSRWTLALFFTMSVFVLAVKRVVVRKTLRAIRKRGKNLKTVVIVGSSGSAVRYLNELKTDMELGYETLGYAALREDGEMSGVPYLGGLDRLKEILETLQPDEVVSAIAPEEYGETPGIIDACEQAGVKLSIIPVYAEYMPARPQFDDLNGIPLLNIRRIPLDNFANAFLKRVGDILLSGLALIVLSPLFLFCALGVKISSPGPVIFKQQRVGKHKKPFTMYKFRSMRVNDEQDRAWSRKTDDRRTRFGSFLRKFSLDELPQLLNVFLGTMSLIGPRPEIPHFVDQFKDSIPLYMVRHQVRPGMTGWAQINGLRGDTPIKERIEYDIEYIENWSPLFDLRILLSTVFRAKFVNNEQTGNQPDPDKLLIVASTWGHIRSFHLPYLKELKDRGREVHVACRDLPEAPENVDGGLELPLEKRMWAPANFRASRLLRKDIRRERYSLIVTHTSLAAFFTRLAVLGMRRRPRVVNVVHGYLFDDDTPRLKRQLLLGAERFVASVTDLVLTMNGWDEDLAMRFCLGKAVGNIPGMGVDFARLDEASPEAGQELRQELGISSEAFVLLYAAEFSRRKSQKVLIRAMQKLPERAVLVLCGDGAELERMKALAKKLRLGDRVRFPGRVEDMPRWYRMADAAVTASRTEGLPFNVMEAMHLGLPIAASAVKGNTDLIRDEETGLLYPYGDAEACAAALMRLMDSPDLRKALGERAAEEAGQYALDRVLPIVLHAILEE